jgi:hypothetical protein
LTGLLGHAPRATNARLLEEGETHLSGARGRLFFPDGEKMLLTSAILHCLDLPELPPGAKPAWPKAEALDVEFSSSLSLAGAKGNEYATPCTTCHEEWNSLAPERDRARLELEACNRDGSGEGLF